MGRRPTEPGAITRLRKRKRGKLTYYYYLGGSPRREISLGKDYGLAILEYAKLEKDRTATAHVKSVVTFAYVASRYLVEILPTKAARTQKDNLAELKQLLAFFNGPPAPLDEIEPQHIKQYLRERGKKALMSAIWNFAREYGYTSLANPCAGVKGHKETGRGVYIEDDVFASFYEKGCAPLRNTMDLAYLTGQRMADVLKMDERDIVGGYLSIRQNKTAAMQRMEVAGQLEEVSTRISARKAALKIRSTKLIVTVEGAAMTTAILRKRFDDAREAAGVPKADFQMRDLRAKADTDKAESSGDILQAKDQLGHTTIAMTEYYIRKRKGKKITSTK